MELVKDKVAIVTGAAAGIGAGVARLFAAEGAHVFLLDTDRTQVASLATALREEGHSAHPFEADVRDRAALAQVVENAIALYGKIDILVNNAGIYPRQAFFGNDRGTVGHYPGRQHEEYLSLYKAGIATHGQAECRVHRKHLIGHFLSGLKHLTHYVASKGAVVGFTRSLAREIGEHNIRVNCITPGAVETEGEKKIVTKEQADAVMELQSLQRRISPLDIARVCLFLSSDLSAGMTGQTLNVDGGWVMY